MEHVIKNIIAELAATGGKVDSNPYHNGFVLGLSQALSKLEDHADEYKEAYRQVNALGGYAADPFDKGYCSALSVVLFEMDSLTPFKEKAYAS